MEEAVFAQGAKDFVGGDVDKAKPLTPGSGQGEEIGARRLQQRIGADDVGLDERRRPVDGAVNMGFCRQVQDHVRLVGCQDALHCGLVGDVCALVLIARIAVKARQGQGIGCIGHLIHVDDCAAEVVKHVVDKSRPDEAAAAGNQEFQGVPASKVKQGCRSANWGHARSRGMTWWAHAGQGMSSAGSFHRMPPSEAGS